MDKERYKRQFKNNFRVHRGYIEKALHWLKRYHPDYRNITISQPNLLNLPINKDVSDQVLNIKESNKIQDKKPGKKGNSRVYREEDKRGINRDIPSPS